MSESFNERSAGIWFSGAFYLLAGVYMIAFWGILDTSAYGLAILGVLSVVVGAFLFTLSRWAFWIGLFTFPVYLVEFLYAITSSVNLVGWFPDALTGAFQSSMIVYLIFLCLSFIVLIDKRNTLKKDRAVDALENFISSRKSEKVI
jgi:hypothetical protein